MIKKAWTGYAAVLSAVVAIGEATHLARGGPVDIRTFSNWVLTAALLVATWGYALQQPIGSMNYWRPVFWVLLSATLVTIVPALLAGTAAMIVVAVLLPFVAPAFYAAYRYAYRSPQVWRAGQPAS